MRNTGCVIPKLLAALGLGGFFVGVAACIPSSQFGSSLGPLTPEEMQATVGLQTADYVCFEDAGCCQGLQCGMCPNCYQCTNDVGRIGTCQSSSGMTCTTLPNHNCGDLMQGVCVDNCAGSEFCEMDAPVLVGSCGTISQCQ